MTKKLIVAKTECEYILPYFFAMYLLIAFDCP